MMGYFIPFIIIIILVTIHEVGHSLFLLYYSFDIDKIYLYPYGGVCKYNSYLNISLKKEFIVLIMGPIFQIIGCILLVNINFFSNYVNLIFRINMTILFFNLLPIYPLDGGKLLNIIFNYFYNYNKSIKLIIIISYLVILLLSIYYFKTSFSISSIFMVIFLLYKVGDEWKNRRLYYNKFLVERYLYDYKFNKYKIINSTNDFYRDCRHVVKGKDRFYSEKETLKSIFCK